MRLSTLITSAFLLGTAAAALSPQTHHKLVASADSPLQDQKLSKRAQAAAIRDAHFRGSRNSRSAPSRNSNPRLPVNPVTSRTINADIPNTSAISANWAGADVSPPSGETFKSATGTMVLPTLTQPSTDVGPYGNYFLYVWVGIDGDNCDALWQTGFAGEVDPDSGETTWWGWVCFIWDTDYAFDTYILDASTGDTINMTVDTSSSSEGVFWLDNLSTGESVSYNVTGGDLCGNTAEWIVEDPYASSGSGVEYFLVWPDFGTMTFENCVAITEEGTVVGPANATFDIIDSYYDGETQNSVSVTEDTVSVAWVASGPAT